MHPTPGKNPSPHRGGEILPLVESDFLAEQYKKGLTTCASSTKIKLITACEKIDKLEFGGPGPTHPLAPPMGELAAP